MRATQLVTLFLTLAFSASYASDFSSSPYLIRLAFALETSPNYSDTAGLLASTGDPIASSTNPAGAGFPLAQNDPTYAPLTATTINALSESGAYITAAAITSTLATEAAGTWSPAYAYTTTVSSTNSYGLDNTLDSHELFLKWSNVLAPNLSIGVAARHVASNISSQSLSRDLGAVPVQAKTGLSSTDVRIGILARISESFFAGVTVGGSSGKATSRVSNIFAIGLIPPGTLFAKVDDAVNTKNIALGLGYKPQKSFGAYFDLQHSEVETGSFQDVSLQRAALGLELGVTRETTLRAGIRVDSESEVTLAAGVGILINEVADCNVAYQWNAAPEIAAEFGRVDFLNASLALRF